MSRAERRQYQRTIGRGRTGGSTAGAPPPRRQRPSSDAQRSARAARTEPERAEPAGPLFTRRFWTWTLIGALAAGLILLSVSWDPFSRPASESVAWGAVGTGLWIVGAVGARLLSRRLSSR